jgi:hypothetical protein
VSESGFLTATYRCVIAMQTYDSEKATLNFKRAADGGVVNAVSHSALMKKTRATHSLDTSTHSC